MQFRRYITAVAVASLAVLHCGARETAMPRFLPDSPSGPQVPESGALVFESREIDAGRLSEDDAPSDFVFTFRNRSEKPVVITRVETSCGCAAADYSRRPIPPGGRGEVKVTYDPKGQAGKLFRKIFVYTNASETRSAAILAITGEVTPTLDAWDGYPVRMGGLRAKRDFIRFGEVTRSTSQSESIECVNSGDKPLKLYAMRGMTPEWLSFRTEPEVIAPGQTADMIVTVDGRRLPEDGRQEYVLIIEGIGGRPSQRSVRITVDMKGN